MGSKNLLTFKKVTSISLWIDLPRRVIEDLIFRAGEDFVGVVPRGCHRS